MQDESLVRTRAGTLQGRRASGITTFLGIPYGECLNGQRFGAPLPKAQWSGTREAFSYGPMAPQAPRVVPPGIPQALAACMFGEEPMGEDCLYLNVWTPQTTGSRPVMVWLHPGGFSAGTASAAVCDGTNLARRGDVVVVSVAQRLNVFGYLYLAEIGGPGYADSGNAGQLDLILALCWIRDNIAAFGGNPGNITLFGESGGGCKICSLLSMPAAKGLFHKAIVQSGPMMRGVPTQRATDAANFVIDALGLQRSELYRLQDVEMRALIGAYAKACQAGFFRTFSPVLDGLHLLRDPFIPDAPAQAGDIPLLIGFNATETTLLLAGEPQHFKLDWIQLPKFLTPHLEGAAAEPVIVAARALRPDASASELFFEITSQMMVMRTSVRIAELKAQQPAAVYMYQVNWSIPVGGGQWRSPHTLEIPLVFNNVAAATTFLGIDDEPQRLADWMSDAWVAFARSGNPATAQLPLWPRFDNTAATMIFDSVPVVRRAPTAELAQALQAVPLWHCTG